MLAICRDVHFRVLYIKPLHCWNCTLKPGCNQLDKSIVEQDLVFVTSAHFRQLGGGAGVLGLTGPKRLKPTCPFLDLPVQRISRQEDLSIVQG